MIVRATLTLEPHEDLLVEPGAGRLTHALALDLVRRGDPGVSAWLHPPGGRRGPRPAPPGGQSPARHASLLATSGVVTGRSDDVPDFARAVPVSAGGQVQVRLTALGAPVCAALLAGLQQTEELELAHVRCDVLAVHVDQVSLARLWRAALRDEGSPVVRFLTPTVFERRGVYVALPLPERVFGCAADVGGLVRRWLDCAAAGGCEGEEHAAELARWEPVHVGAAPLDLREAQVDMGSWGTLGGFVGGCRFVCGPDRPQHRRALWALCRFAEYAGVGLKTGMGLGQVRLAPAAQARGQGTAGAG